MPSSYSKHAQNAYKNSAYGSMSDRESMAEAFRVLINHLTQAKELQAKGDFESMLVHTHKVIKIVDVLYKELLGSDAFNDPEAIPPAKFLVYTYQSLLERTANVLQAPSPSEEFDALIELLKPVYRAWADKPEEHAPTP